MKKTLLSIVFIMVGLLIVTGCGKGNLANYAGIYKLEYSKYVGDPDTAKSTEEWTITLNEDGTGKSNRDDSSYDAEWSMDGENIVFIEKFMGIKNEYNGTIKDGKMDIFNGDKTNDLTLEAVFNKQ